MRTREPAGHRAETVTFYYFGSDLLNNVSDENSLHCLEGEILFYDILSNVVSILFSVIKIKSCMRQ